MWIRTPGILFCAIRWDWRHRLGAENLTGAVKSVTPQEQDVVRQFMSTPRLSGTRARRRRARKGEQMMRLSFATLAAIAVVTAGCGSPRRGTAVTAEVLQRNKDVVRASHERVWSQGNLALADQL